MVTRVIMALELAASPVACQLSICATMKIIARHERLPVRREYTNSLVIEAEGGAVTSHAILYLSVKRLNSQCAERGILQHSVYGHAVHHCSAGWSSKVGPTSSVFRKKHPSV